MASTVTLTVIRPIGVACPKCGGSMLPDQDGKKCFQCSHVEYRLEPLDTPSESKRVFSGMKHFSGRKSARK